MLWDFNVLGFSCLPISASAESGICCSSCWLPPLVLLFQTLGRRLGMAAPAAGIKQSCLLTNIRALAVYLAVAVEVLLLPARPLNRLHKNKKAS